MGEGQTIAQDSVKGLDDVETNNGFGTLVPVKIDLYTEGKRKLLGFVDKQEYQQTYDGLLQSMKETTDEQTMLDPNVIKKQVNAPKLYKAVAGECLRNITLNIRIGNVVVKDQFEWDINNP